MKLNFDGIEIEVEQVGYFDDFTELQPGQFRAVQQPTAYFKHDHSPSEYRTVYAGYTREGQFLSQGGLGGLATPSDVIYQQI